MLVKAVTQDLTASFAYRMRRSTFKCPMLRVARHVIVMTDRIIPSLGQTSALHFNTSNSNSITFPLTT